MYTSVMNTLVPRKEKGVNLRIKYQGRYYAGRVLREEKEIAPVQMGGGKRFGRMIWRKDKDWDSVIGCSLSWAPDTLRSKLRTRWAVAARMAMVRGEGWGDWWIMTSLCHKKELKSYQGSDVWKPSLYDAKRPDHELQHLGTLLKWIQGRQGLMPREPAQAAALHLWVNRSHGETQNGERRLPTWTLSLSRCHLWKKVGDEELFQKDTCEHYFTPKWDCLQ